MSKWSSSKFVKVYQARISSCLADQLIEWFMAADIKPVTIHSLCPCSTTSKSGWDGTRISSWASNMLGDNAEETRIKLLSK